MEPLYQPGSREKVHNSSFHAVAPESSSSSYQPPTHHLERQQQSQQYRNPERQEDDEEFTALASSLLRKQAAYKFPPSHVINNLLSEEERRRFSELFYRLTSEQPVSIYPEAGEAPIVALVRDVREVFGSSLMQIPATLPPRETHGSDNVRDMNQDRDDVGVGQQYNRTDDLDERVRHPRPETYSREHVREESRSLDGKSPMYKPHSHSAHNDDRRGGYDGGDYYEHNHFDSLREDRHLGPNRRGGGHSNMAKPKDVHRGGRSKDPTRSYEVSVPVRMDRVDSHHTSIRSKHQRVEGNDGHIHTSEAREFRDLSSRYNNMTKNPDFRRDPPLQSRSYEISVPSRESPESLHSNRNRHDHNDRAQGFRGQPQVASFQDEESVITHRGEGEENDEVADLKNALSIDDAKTIHTQSKVRQQLMEEIDNSRTLLGRAANNTERSFYESHLRQLKSELENMNRSFSPTTSVDAASTELAQLHTNKVAELELPSFEDGEGTVASRRSANSRVNVVAPETLPANYSFEARLGDETFTATVPEGGVRKGDIFSTRMGVDVKTNTDDAPSIARPRTFETIEIPRNRWRDELFDCMNEGPLHPLFWHSWFCPQIALAQIMTRLRLSSCSNDGTALKSRVDVKTVVLLSVCFYTLNGMLAYIIASIIIRGYNVPLLVTCLIPMIIVDAGLVCYFFYMTVQTRKNIRATYAIPESRCVGREDELVTVFCTSCTVSQMGRHTADFNTYRASCCTETGLPDHIEVNL